MSDQEVLRLISQLSNDRWRSLLVPLLDADENVRVTAYEELYAALKSLRTQANPLWPNGPDALRLVEIGMTVRFPHKHHWRNPANQLLFWFVTIKWPPLVGKVAEHFAAADDSARLDGMTILAAQHTEEAMRALGALIEQHGIPSKMYQRLSWELNKSFEYADYLLPQLVLRAGGYLPAVMDFLNVAHERGTLTHAKLAPALEFVEKEASQLLPKVRRRQRKGDGKRWRFTDKYIELSHTFGAYLDMLSLIPGASTALLEKSASLKDPRLLSIVAYALLRRGVEPPREVVCTAAASHVVRPYLYRALKGFDRLDLFPDEQATFEAFAASHMAEWLRYPTELGYEPERLELAATVRGTNDDGERQWCLWKFTDDKGIEYAGVSGPYPLPAPVGPLEGGDVFSNFAEWDSATPEQHLESVLETLRDWRVHRVEDDS